jgi:hypothetical protein
MAAFTTYSSATHALSTLTSALLSTASGIQVDAASIVLRYGSGISYSSSTTASSLSFYDGSLTDLGIGAGLLLTSGTGDPATSNTSGSYTTDLDPSETDTDLSATVHTAFPSAGAVEDATVLQFQFTVSDPTLQSVQFDLVFGSDEYPEWSDSSYVDVAGVYVNGVNYALFNNSANQPLSILDTNLAAGSFRNNTTITTENGIALATPTVLPIEYDGVSNKLTIVAPVTAGTNTIKIAVADTGDQNYDSGLFISSLHAVGYTGNGLALETIGTDGNEWLQGNSFNDYIDLGDGNDIVTGGLGDDLLIGGDGYDAAVFAGILSQYGVDYTGNGFSITGPDGNDTLVGFDFGLFGSDLYGFVQPAGLVSGVYALLLAGFNAAPDTDTLSQWVASAYLNNYDLGELGQAMIDTWAPGISNEAVITHLYQTIAGVTPSASDIATFNALIGQGQIFGNQGDLFAYAALLDLNTAEFAGLIGQAIALELDYFV